MEETTGTETKPYKKASPSEESAYPETKIPTLTIK